jgi:hypothetical protein
MTRSGLRDACLSETLFTPMLEAPAVLATWRRDDNTIRSHSKPGSVHSGNSPVTAAVFYDCCIDAPFERIML